MAFFTTFYSFKGGVGRSLALANVAWLMANHPSERAKVLVMDFDLGAPGLHRILGMANSRKSAGLIDYVLEFLDTAAQPNISPFIHKTSYPGIDILPAGRMDRSYQRRLEKLNWTEIYESAFGFELFEGLKKQISALPTAYDYVLVDSLTGYSDVGGICVKQIPETVVMLFRLNQQNLDGTRNVYRSLGSDRSDSETPTINVIPVITPAWPFLDRTASDWVEKAQRLFLNKKLLKITFNGGLSFGESVVSADTNSPLSTQVHSDYWTLAQHVRDSNAADPLTIWNSIQEDTSFLLSESTIEQFIQLLQLRRKNIQYWSFLPRVLYPFFNRKVGHKEQFVYDKLMSFTDQECEARNEYALFGRALLAEVPGKRKRNFDAIADLSAALAIQPRFVDALLLRGRSYLMGNHFAVAAKDYQTALNALSKSDAKYARTARDLGAIYLALRDTEKANMYCDIAIRLGSNEPYLLLTASKARYLAGDYARALRMCKKIIGAQPFTDTARMLAAQILVAMGRTTAANEELSSITATEDVASADNLAEAYLSVDPSRTLALLSRKGKTPFNEVDLLLRFVAKTLLGQDASKEETALRQRESHTSTWDDLEIVALIKAKQRADSLSQPVAEHILSVTNAFISKRAPNISIIPL